MQIFDPQYPPPGLENADTAAGQAYCESGATDRKSCHVSLAPHANVLQSLLQPHPPAMQMLKTVD